MLGIGGACVLLVGWHRLERDVTRRLAARGTPTVAFVDMPDVLVGTADIDLQRALWPVLGDAWLDDRVCRDMASRVASVAWVERVRHVRRQRNGRFDISCAYRVPFATVQHDDQYFLVDATGVRLPGEYRDDPSWLVIRGVAAPPPAPGALWPGADVQAGLATVRAVVRERFAKQITAVLLENFDGRVNPRRPHVELATDRAGGRILWGSPPGREVAENDLPQKLAILRAYYERTGRVDANHVVVDVSTHPGGAVIRG